MHQRRAPVLTDVAISLVHAELLSGWKTTKQAAACCGLETSRVIWCRRYLALSRPVFKRWALHRRIREYRMFPQAIEVTPA